MKTYIIDIINGEVAYSVLADRMLLENGIVLFLDASGILIHSCPADKTIVRQMDELKEEE